MSRTSRRYGRGILYNAEGAKILGYYTPGGTPTVIHYGKDDDAYLTGIHETTHKDDLINTFYGHVVILQDRIARDDKIPPLLRRRAHNNVSRLLKRAWTVLEGSAVCSEALDLIATGQQAKLKSHIASLPWSYYRAFSYYRFIVNWYVDNLKSEPPPVLFPWFLGLKSALACAALDYDFFRRKPHTLTFESMTSIALGSRPFPTLWKVLRNGCQGLDMSSMEPIVENMLEHKSEYLHDPESELSFPLLIHIALRSEILRRTGCEHYGDYISDHCHHEVKGRSVERLKALHPSIHGRFDKRMVGLARRAEFAVAGRHSFEVLDCNEAEFSSALSQACNAVENSHTLIWAQPEFGETGILVQAMTYRPSAEGANEFHVANLAIRAWLPMARVLEVDREMPKLNGTWIGRLYDHIITDRIERRFWQQLEGTVQLWSRTVDYDFIEPLIEELPPPLTLTLSPAPGNIGLYLWTVARGNISYFFVDNAMSEHIMQPLDGVRVSSKVFFARGNAQVNSGADIGLWFLANVMDAPQ